MLARQVFARPPLRDQKVVWLPLTPWQEPVYEWQLRMDPSKLAGLYDRSETRSRRGFLPCVGVLAVADMGLQAAGRRQPGGQAVGASAAGVRLHSRPGVVNYFNHLRKVVSHPHLVTDADFSATLEVRPACPCSGRLSCFYRK